ncbi:pentatricopeptide repeat protein-like protein [Amylocarpus encephaloides]|uniref:Pentatricopeptide repeat protein-like protein n=1 Tax=Amylocarpus encephaloides TaxID=45428 RepID=A0A9P7YAB2_9HELO|nr:pentatricopeptide repeat protein-like protein [Amylocarpus encephaloides]
MPPLRIPIDGLWRCLCPSFEIYNTSYTGAQQIIPKSARQYSQVNRQRARTRAFHTSSQFRSQTATLTTQDSQPGSGLNVRRHVSSSQVNRPANGPYDGVALTHLYEKLRMIKSEEGSYQSTLDLVEYLITQREEEPALIHYDALICANADAENGSVANLRCLLEEMKEEGIQGNSASYHAILQVLAVHPNYVLRSEIMNEMRGRWLGLSPEGYHSFVIGLLRDRQYEMAMDKLEQMQADQIPIQPWLYDIFTYNLCAAGELDQAYHMLVYRFENDRKEISPNTWYYLLDIFSRAYHYEGAKFIWSQRVQTSFLNPSDGICTNILNLAARYCDPSLATATSRILSSRHTVLTPFHYESLLEAYVGTVDLQTAFKLLNIMSKAGCEPDSGTTRSIYRVLTGYSSHTPFQAWRRLKDDFGHGHPVHIAAANVIIEAAITSNTFELGLDMYKELNSICAMGPNTETFNILLQGAEKRKIKKNAMFLASEMIAHGVKADHLTYDRLIMICLNEDNYDDAFNYLDEMAEVGKDKFEQGRKGWWMRKGTLATMVERCVVAGDNRWVQILEEAVRRQVVTPFWAELFVRRLQNEGNGVARRFKPKWRGNSGTENQAN